MQLLTYINKNHHKIKIVAHDGPSNDEMIIEVTSNKTSGDQSISMTLPASAMDKITKKYLRICGQKLVEAHSWSEDEIKNLYS
jgi:hypothetical protein